MFVAGAGPPRATDPTTTTTAQLVADAGLRTLVYDRLGRGESEASGDLTLERELAALSAAIDAVGGRAVLVGHSSGSAIALVAAVTGLPVDGLVLWEAPIGQFRTGAAEFEADFLRHLDAGDLEAAQVEYMRDMPPEFLERARSMPQWPQIFAGSRTYRADARALAWAEEVPLEERLSGVDVPALVAVGEQTSPGMAETAERLAAALPRAGLRRLPGAMHSWEPRAMADAIVELVRG